MMINKKNILLIDRSEDMLESVAACEHIHIAILIVESEKQKKPIRDKYPHIGTIYTMDEAQAPNPAPLNYENMEIYRATQLKVEHCLWRFTNSYSHIQYIYYNALSFWLDLFGNTTIEAVLVSEIELGTPYISIPIDIAKKRKISAFLFDPILNNGIDLLAKGVNFYNKNEYIDLSVADGSAPIITIDDFLFRSIAHKIDPKYILKDKLKAFAFTPWGMLLLTVLSLLTDKFTVSLNGFKVKWIELLSNTLFLNKMSKYYNLLSIAPTQKEKFVFYAMHFEPEASIMVRTPLGNQISIIKMISDALPKGWKLYVKEHPHQFGLANETRWYQLKNIFFFRNKEFYQELKKIKNVELIPLSTPSKALIENAECIASINGTVAIEGIKYKKPVMLFGHLSTPIGYCEDIFKITNTSDVHNSIKRMIDGFNPEYTDFTTVTERFLFKQTLNGKIELSPAFWKYLITQEIDK